MKSRLLFSLLIAAALNCMNAQPVLKDAFKESFRVCAALNRGVFTEESVRDAALVKAQFNTITPNQIT